MASPYGTIETHDRQMLRCGVWPCGSDMRHGSVLLLGGRSEFMEKYGETIADLHRRGFDVFSFDWRGQGLSSRLTDDPLKGYVASYDDYVKDLEVVVDRWVRPAARIPLMILAHSMGGHIALRYVRDHPGIIDRAVLVSPMIDILPGGLLRRAARLITRLAIRARRDRAYMIGYGPESMEDSRFRGNRLTSDPVRFRVSQAAIAATPELALGGITYGWLAATFDSIDLLNRRGYPEGIQTPVQMVGGGADRVVSIHAQRNLCRRIPGCRFRQIDGARHEILMETDAIRRDFWEIFDTFAGVSGRPGTASGKGNGHVAITAHGMGG
jgi:lysophospholipase